jgi:hypothetical protein
MASQHKTDTLHHWPPDRFKRRGIYAPHPYPQRMSDAVKFFAQKTNH